MKRILIALMTTFFVFGCKSEQKNNLNELEPDKKLSKLNTKRTESNILFDTLVFNKDMNGELLTEKYALGFLELQFYKQFVLQNKINEKQILTEEHTKTEITYLGKLMDLDNQNSYHVITNFKIIGIGEMESPRGISNLVFINNDLDKAIIYRMGLPDELPEKIENNNLYFTLKSKRVGIAILGGLPPMLCLPEIGCN
ncbi:hypothetical protein [Flavobacterium sp. HNIBRBA15423]|uniref:hypothetical protein n=1 Tax=Flavobacterium sp. HNIBRBA15423 TaxID=3458683 RepID=UPI004044E892